MIKSAQKRWYYVGSTNRLHARLQEHDAGYVRSTKMFAPFSLVYKKEFAIEKDARMYEREVKKSRSLKRSIIKSIENS